MRRKWLRWNARVDRAFQIGDGHPGSPPARTIFVSLACGCAAPQPDLTVIEANDDIGQRVDGRWHRLEVLPAKLDVVMPGASRIGFGDSTLRR